MAIKPARARADLIENFIFQLLYLYFNTSAQRKCPINFVELCSTKWRGAKSLFLPWFWLWTTSIPLSILTFGWYYYQSDVQLYKHTIQFLKNNTILWQKDYCFCQYGCPNFFFILLSFFFFNFDLILYISIYFSKHYHTCSQEFMSLYLFILVAHRNLFCSTLGFGWVYNLYPRSRYKKSSSSIRPSPV